MTAPTPTDLEKQEMTLSNSELDIILDQLWENKHLGKAYDHAYVAIETLIYKKSIDQLQWAKELRQITNRESWHEAVKERISELKDNLKDKERL